jgi:hypothetical protein
MATQSISKHTNAEGVEQDQPNRVALEMYQAFMAGYVRRINEATFKVAVGGIRIGNAKYSRLAQINLKSRVLTFSRYAIENVPERGRRYLVIHELAHVKEPSHNRHFWELVARYEPDYRQINKTLELAFKRNVESDDKSQGAGATGNLIGTGKGKVPLKLLSISPSSASKLEGTADSQGNFPYLIAPDQASDDMDEMCWEDEIAVE